APSARDTTDPRPKYGDMAPSRRSRTKARYSTIHVTGSASTGVSRASNSPDGISPPDAYTPAGKHLSSPGLKNAGPGSPRAAASVVATISRLRYSRGTLQSQSTGGSSSAIPSASARYAANNGSP